MERHPKQDLYPMFPLGFESQNLRLNNHGLSPHLLAIERQLAVDIIQFIMDITGDWRPIPNYDGTNILIDYVRKKTIFTSLSAERIEKYAEDRTKQALLPRYTESVRRAVRIYTRDFNFSRHLKPVLFQLHMFLDQMLKSPIFFSLSALGDLKCMKEAIGEYLLIGDSSSKQVEVKENSGGKNQGQGNTKNTGDAQTSTIPKEPLVNSAWQDTGILEKLLIGAGYGFSEASDFLKGVASWESNTEKEFDAIGADPNTPEPLRFAVAVLKLPARIGTGLVSGVAGLGDLVINPESRKQLYEGLKSLYDNPEQLEKMAEDFADQPAHEIASDVLVVAADLVMGGAGVKKLAKVSKVDDAIAENSVTMSVRESVPDKTPTSMNSSNLSMSVGKATPELIKNVSQKRQVVFAKEGSEDLAYLDFIGAEANVGGADYSHILLRESPGKAAVLEEFLHGTQSKLGIIDELGTSGLGSAETHVKDFMIRHQKMLGLSDEDIKLLQQLRDAGL